MTKFIACEDGEYINIMNIEAIRVVGYHPYSIECRTQNLTCILISKFLTKQEAQEWLDKFMEKHGLLLEPTTPSRCF